MGETFKAKYNRNTQQWEVEGTDIKIPKDGTVWADKPQADGTVSGTASVGRYAKLPGAKPVRGVKRRGGRVRGEASRGEYARDVYYPGRDNRKGNTMAEEVIMRKEAQNKLKSLLGERGEIMLRNDNGGDEARLSNSSIRKMTSSLSVSASIKNGFTGAQHLDAATDIVGLYKNAFKLEDRADRNGKPDVRIQRYGAPLGIDDGIAFITVKESTIYGKKVHNVELVEIGKLGGTLAAEEVTPLHKPTTPSFLYDNNIRKLESAVNRQSKKTSSPAKTEASEGDYAASESARPASDAGVRGIERPEAINLVREILGEYPKVRKMLKDDAQGLAVHTKEGDWIEIRLAADAAKDPDQFDKILFHELGHAMTKYGGSGKRTGLWASPAKYGSGWLTGIRRSKGW